MSSTTDVADAEAPEADSAPSRARRSRLDTVVGVLGELLILAGVLLALFVVWQLFYTDVQADREQEEIVEDLGWAQPVDAGGDIDAVDDIAVPDVVPLIPDELKQTGPLPDAIPAPAHATTFGAMYVPRWGDDYVKPISEGVTRRDVLDKLGIGHYPNTAMPGELGNFAVAGHRTTYGKPFADIQDLVVGDALIVQTEDYWFVYTMTDSTIVQPSQTSVIAAVPDNPGATPDRQYITLTTCHPKYSAAQRYIVHGELAYWAPTGHGYPSEMVEDLA